MSTHAPFPRESGADGSWQRQRSAFREWVRADGSTPFAPEAGRYHLYVSLACPWAHRTVIMRALRGLEDAVSMTVVDPERDERGWAIRPDQPGCTDDPVNGFVFLSEAYAASDASWEGRVSVPVLWDTVEGRIVNNESTDILRMLDVEFAGVARRPEPSYYPDDLAAEMEPLMDDIYERVNNGVYRCGFATTQEAYDEAFADVFAGLDALDERLASRRYLMGDRLTEADWRLFTTLVRFDPVYVGHFKCNLRRIADYPNLSNYLRDLYQVPGVAETVDLHHIKNHYYRSHETLNSGGIVPKGPALAYDAPHDRSRFGQSAPTRMAI